MKFAKNLLKKKFQRSKAAFDDHVLPPAEALEQATYQLSCELIKKPSVTPNDAGCMEIISARLVKLGMLNERMDSSPVSNLFCSFNNHKPLFVFVGHTDVVPPGDLSCWQTDPFKPEDKNGYLCGRGSVDMKSAVAAMVVAIENFAQLKIEKNIDIGLVLTSDEEGDAIQGVKHLVERLNSRGQKAVWAVVGEPSSEQQLGDSIKIGRRGSLTAKVTLRGKQGHVGYPSQIINPVNYANKLLLKLENKQWDLPSRFFPATTFQVVKFQCDSGAENLSPASVEFVFNMRFSPKQTAKKLQNYIQKKIKRLELDYDVEWKIDAEPFITRRSLVRKVVSQVVQSQQKIKPKLSTSGGTSDGRFFAQMGTKIVELGLCNKTIHQANERAPIADLGLLASLYLKILIQMNAENV